MNCKKPNLVKQASAAGLLVIATLAIVGCGYGEVSPVTYQYAKALYSLSNKQSADRIDEVERQITAAAASGELPEHEAGWLREICDQCRDGEWETAQAAARHIMQDQVK